MSPELKRAIIKFVPDYFSWDKKRQEQYRVDTPEEDEFKIRQFLLRELFDIYASNDDEVEEARRVMNEAQCLKLNAILLPIKGIGEDFFFLKESQLDELKHRFWKHISEVHERLMDEFDKKSKQRVFILNQSQVGDPSHHFLFTDKEILKRIHFKTFMRDCRAAEQTDHASLSRKLEEEKQLLATYLDKEYKDITENFDPKIVRFRKKYKVILHRDSGLDELL